MVGMKELTTAILSGQEWIRAEGSLSLILRLLLDLLLQKTSKQSTEFLAPFCITYYLCKLISCYQQSYEQLEPRLRSCSYSGFKGCIKYQGNGRNLSHSLPALIILFMLKLLSVLALAVSATCLVEPTDFDYRNHGADWAACPSSASKQSPIILSENSSLLSPQDSYLFCEFQKTAATINYLNTTIYINTTDSFGSTYTRLIDGNSVPFKATQMRLRMHAEHQVEGESFHDLQLQVFHGELYTTSRNYKMALSVFFQATNDSVPDPFINSIIEAYSGQASASVDLDLSAYLSKAMTSDFWFYVGSLTIPPCSNGKLNWIVLREPRAMTIAQKQKLIEILSLGDSSWPGNWRKTQDLNSNQVGLKRTSS